MDVAPLLAWQRYVDAQRITETTQKRLVDVINVLCCHGMRWRVVEVLDRYGGAPLMKIHPDKWPAILKDLTGGHSP